MLGEPVVLVTVAVPIAAAVGVALLDAEEALLAPLTFSATTVNVLAVPTLRFPTTIGLLVPYAAPPLDGVTINPIIALPPVAPAVKATDADKLPAVAVP